MADNVRLLGVTLDHRLSMNKHWTKSVVRAFTTYVHCNIFDQPSPSAMPTWLPAQSSAPGSTTPTPCCMAHHPRTLIVFNASKMHWLDASWTRKLIEARLHCCINYTGCPSVIVLTLNLLNSRSSLVHLLLACSLIHQSLDTCHLTLSALRILTFSLFLGQRQSSVRARSMLLHRPFLILSLRTSDQPTTSLRFAAFWRRFTSAMPSINTSDIIRASDSTYFVDIARIKKFILTYLCWSWRKE